MKKKLELFLIFFKIGLFTFGGGYAMVALLEAEFVSKRNWLTREEFLDMVAIAESTPGPIAINAATYIGNKMYGFLGALFATLGVCLPSFSIIYIISLFFDKFLENDYVSYAFKGIQVCVIYLIFSAGIKLFKGLTKNVMNITVFLAVTVLLVILSLASVRVSTIVLILISGFLGLMVYLIKKSPKKEA